MALIYNKVKDVPQTHALIIGVGGYPYLEKDENGNQQTDTIFRRLKNLQSPAESAAEFYHTLTSYGKSLIRPLGSVELLISDMSTDNYKYEGLETELPTTEVIGQAYMNWKARCNSHEDNIAVFFFSGHGIEKTDHILMAADFGKYHDRTWLKGLIDIDTTRAVFHECRAQTQLFFIDSCRSVIPEQLARAIRGEALDSGTYLISECKYNLTVKAAVHNRQAFGRTGEPSYFTRALIKAMDGSVAEEQGNHWVVGTQNISGGINQLLKKETGEIDKQRCICITSDSTAILRRSVPPMVSLAVISDPEVALSHAELSCVNIETNEAHAREPMPDPWNLKVSAGIYRISAEYNTGEYRSSSRNKFVKPPFDHHIIVCQ